MILPKEKQCVSLDTAKRMKELGFRQNTEYYWVNLEDDEMIVGMRDKDAEYILPMYDIEFPKSNQTYILEQRKKILSFDEELRKDWASAYTTSELGDILKNICGQSLPLFDGTCWHCNKCYGEIEADNEAEVRGLLAFHLKERGLL